MTIRDIDIQINTRNYLIIVTVPNMILTQMIENHLI